MINRDFVLRSKMIFSDLGSAIRGVCHAWCEEQGYSDPFCRNGAWWAFPPNGVIPVQIKTVMGEGCQRPVKIGPVELALRPDGSLANVIDEQVISQK